MSARSSRGLTVMSAAPDRSTARAPASRATMGCGGAAPEDEGSFAGILVVAVAGVAVDLWLDVGVGFVGHGPFHGGELLVVAPPLVDVGLDQRRQPGRPLRVCTPQDGVAGLGGHED